MDFKKQQEINVALLKCLVTSHKAMMRMAGMLTADINEKSEKIKIYEEANERYFEAMDRCFDLMEDSENGQ